MPEASEFLKNLTLVLGVAALSSLIFHRLRQPVVLGYLLAGLIIGPHFPLPLVADSETIHTLSELGVILLMFSLGLEFSLRKLMKNLPTAGVVALIQCSLMLWFGYLVGRGFAWTLWESVYAGAIIAISSTTIIIKAFSEEKVKGSLTHLVFAILIVEDLIAILLLAILPAFSLSGELSGWMLAKTGGMLLIFLLTLVVGGLLVIPRLIRRVLAWKRPEITLLVSIGLAFAFSLLAKEMNYSVALGAFLAGSVMAESGGETYLETLIAPVRDMFAAVFFVSVGMLIDPRMILEHWAAILAFTALVLGGKILSVSLGAFISGHSTRLSLQAGMSLAQIGEFSFIIAGVAIAGGGERNFLYPVAVSVSALTTLTTPWLIRHSDAVAKWVDRRLPQPLQTFTCLYATWIHRLQASRKGAERSVIRRLLVSILVDLSLCIVLIIAAGLSAAELQAKFVHLTGLPASWARALLTVAAILLVAPFAVGLVRSARLLGLNLARLALPKKEDGHVDLAAAPRRAMVVAFQLFSLILIGAPLLALTQPFLPYYFGGILWVLLLAILGIAFWRSAANLHGHVKAGAKMLIEKLNASLDRGKEQNFPEAEKMLPGLGNLLSYYISADSVAVGRTLSDLNLRALTGANVFAITGKTGNVLVPTGQELLREGDTLALSGTPEALAAAKAMLGSSGG
ncbi:MAG TPA: potassium transporter [Deltaproteobacteria bacterium]|nr:potassium transporter [Deltaproteobacteria bacterium]